MTMLDECLTRNGGNRTATVGAVAIGQRLIIGLNGAADSGKSTIASYLAHAHGFTRIRFAGRLKAMMRALGCTDAEIEGNRKELPCALLGGRTPRHAMQTLGTEWGRNLIAPDLWTSAWRAEVERTAGPIVVDDLRFPNERAVTAALGGKIIQVLRPNTSKSEHISEQHKIAPDYIIHNEGSVADLYRTAETILADLK